ATGLSRGPLRSTLPTARSGVSDRSVAASVNGYGFGQTHNVFDLKVVIEFGCFLWCQSSRLLSMQHMQRIGNATSRLL
ncbi:MAG: hypothetical protein R6U98_26350, partial [Pirellulaceae bacterium]